MTPEQSIKKPLNNHNTNQTIFLVCCLWQRAGHADEKRGKDKERGEVDAHNCLKEEFLEVVCGVDDDEDKESGQVGGQQLVDDPPLQQHLSRTVLHTGHSKVQWRDYPHAEPGRGVAGVGQLEGVVRDDELGQNSRARHGHLSGVMWTVGIDMADLLRPDGHPQPVQLLGGQLHRALLGVERIELQLVVAPERLGVHAFVSELWTALNTNSSKIELETAGKLS